MVQLMAARNPTLQDDMNWWFVAPIVLFSRLLLALLLLAVPIYLIWRICLNLIIWSWWCLRGRNILFVYSDSPIWQDYINKNMLPRLGERAVVLNWSQRKSWRFSLSRLAFSHFGGRREFNPMAVVFRPFRWSRTFRFWQPFQDFKHGHPEALRQMEGEFFGLIGVRGK